ncbi:MAG TPA: DUF3995 domain-containing protein [Rhodobacteraceae bacterium]|nr:DUF3995 domain-containing protein [Paracoccaceae bacterium]
MAGAWADLHRALVRNLAPGGWSRGRKPGRKPGGGPRRAGVMAPQWIATGMALSLWAAALLHLFWAFGGLWPARSEPELVRMVIGSRSAAMPPKGVTLAVAVLIGLAGFWPLVMTGRGGLPVPAGICAFGGWGLAAVFLLRAGLGYWPGLWAAELPFYRLNRRYFSPAILAIGAGYVVLSLVGACG